MSELKSLTLNGKTYDCFVDTEARANSGGGGSGGGSVEGAVMYTEQNLTEEQQAQARENIGAVSIVTVDLTTQCELTQFIATGGKIQHDGGGVGVFFKAKENTLYTITVTGEHNRFYINGCMLEEILTGTAVPSIYNSGRTTVTTETETYTFNSADYKSFIVTVAYGLNNPDVSVTYTEKADGVVDLDGTVVYTAGKVDRLLDVTMMYTEQTLTEEQQEQARKNIGAIGATTFKPVQCELLPWIVNMNKVTHNASGLGCFVKVKENTLYKITVTGEHNRFYISGCMVEEVLSGAEAHSIYNSGRNTVTTETETYTINSADYKSIFVTVCYGLTEPDVSVEITEATDGTVDLDGTEVYTAEKVDRLIEPLVFESIVYTTENNVSGFTKTEEIHALYDALVTQYPAYITKNVLGQNSQGASICEYIFTSGNYNDVTTPRSKDAIIPKPTVLVLSGIHGDERCAVMSTYQFFRDMANYLPILYPLREGLTFKVIPVAAPGAFDNGTRVNENGVNVNRNFAYNWAATANDGMNYAGATAADQAEAQILQAWYEENANAVLCVDHHNSGYENEVSMIYGKEVDRVPEVKRVYLRSLAKVIPYWKSKKGFSDDFVFAYTGVLDVCGMMMGYSQDKGITSICLETSWNQNSHGRHSAESVAVGAEVLGNMLLAMYDKIVNL